MSDDSSDRPPAFLRRHLARTSGGDSNALVALACDESYWVRRDAARNPETPQWVLDLLVRAGADPELRGRSHDPDPTLTETELRRLVEGGPWARELVAAHPNTDAEVLAILATMPSRRVRADVAIHARTAPESLSRLCADPDPGIRALAAANPATPHQTIDLLQRAGASPDLGYSSTAPDLDAESCAALASLGAWGRFLAASTPACPDDVLAEVAVDPEWSIRSALLDNAGNPEAIGRDPQALADLSRHESPEVRLAVARSDAADPATLGRLAADGEAEIRRIAARNPHTDPVAIDRLVRAGSTPDLMGLDHADPDLGSGELAELANGGYWARQLVVRHPAAQPTTLARLLCDESPRIREWASVHPSAPQDVISEIHRAGGAEDFQGLAECDPDMTPEELRRVAALGPWGEWLVSMHPHGHPD